MPAGQVVFRSRSFSCRGQMECGVAGADRSERVLHHLGLEVASDDYDTLRRMLVDLGLATREGEHPFMSVEAFYVDDPDGNEVEIVRYRG